MLHSAPSIHENELYQYRRHSQSPTTLRDRAVKAKRSTKADKWDSDSIDDDTLSKWCVERMDSKPQDMLHPQGIVTYNKKAGFKIKIDQMYNFKSKSAWKQIQKVIIAPNPPGGWYKENKETDDVYFTTRHDWKSGAASQKFLDDWTEIKDHELGLFFF